MLEIKPRPLCMLGEHSGVELLSPSFWNVHFTTSASPAHSLLYGMFKLHKPLMALPPGTSHGSPGGLDSIQLSALVCSLGGALQLPSGKICSSGTGSSNAEQSAGALAGGAMVVNALPPVFTDQHRVLSPALPDHFIVLRGQGKDRQW